jgi:enoyl-CoA hydratase/carnithine racemase
VSEPVLVDRQDGVLLVTLNRPETRNAISGGDVIDPLVAVMAQASEDRSVRALVMTGAGTAFSSGGNVKDMAAKAGMFGGGPADLRHGYRHGIQRIARAVYHCEVPTIAAVNGPAIGAGCDLALMCDIRLASTTAVFAESFVKVGIVPGDGGAWLLPRVVGLSRACEMSFTGDPVNSETALAWGLVSRVVEPDSLLDAALDLARRISVNPPDAIRMTKKLIREGQHQTLESALELSAAMQSIAHHTDDHYEAVAAVLARQGAAPRADSR